MTNKIFPFLALPALLLLSLGCRNEPKTEAAFIDQKILTTGMDVRVNALEDLQLFAAWQRLNACQEADCSKFQQALSTAEQSVKALEDRLFQLAGGIKPPPPPCPCETGNCLWAPQGLFGYFVDLKKFGSLPKVSVQTLEGEVISSSEQAEVSYSPGSRQFAVVRLPEQKITQPAVKMVITTDGGTEEILVNIKK